jgi:release factor glutamine methyltransferase
LGTGQLGILAIYAASLCRVQVEAVDINEKFIHNATLVARANGIRSGRFYTSDWFSNVTDRFDLIWANVPYVPTQSGLSRGNLPGYTYIWDGGDDGCLHARHILSNVEGFLSAEGRLLLGMNTFYVPRHHTVALISAVSGLAFENIITARHSHSEVYVIRLANPGGSL